MSESLTGLTTVDGSIFPAGETPYVGNLHVQSYDELLSIASTILTTVCPGFTDVSDGSPAKALLSARAFADTWLQTLIYYQFQNSRLFTANGGAVDTFCADFGLTRQPGISATGTVTFARFSATNTVYVPVGTTVQTSDSTQRFLVTVDVTNPSFDASNGWYVCSPGQFSVDCLCQAQTSGTQGNIKADQITLLFTSLPGISSVSNASPFTGGSDGLSDADFKKRFVTYFNSREKATTTSINNQIVAVDPNLHYEVLENVNGIYPVVLGDPNSGKPRPQNGFFTVYLDSGGSVAALTTQDKINQVSAAINAARAVGINYWVTTPGLLLVDIEYLLQIKPGYIKDGVLAQVAINVTNYVNTLWPGQDLNYHRLGTIIDETPGVEDIGWLIVAGSSRNLYCPPGGIIKLNDLQYASNG